MEMVPHAILTALLLLGLGAAIGLRFRRDRGNGPWDTCPRCGYQLGSMESQPVCPECGLDNPHTARRIERRVRVEQTPGVFYCFLGAALCIAFSLVTLIEQGAQNVMAGAWNALCRAVPSHDATGYLGLEHKPLFYFGLAGGLVVWAIHLLCNGRVKSATQLRLRPLASALLVNLCFASVGFAAGLAVAWVDSGGRHERVLLWTYAGACLGAAVGSFFIRRVVRRRNKHVS